MTKRLKIQPPRYQQIAADIASKIASGTYRVGDKIFARSAIASQYGVSSETARRAICVLSDLHIVTVNKGSGVTIESYDEALKFVKQFTDIQTIADLKQDIENSVQRQLKELDFFHRSLTTLIDQTDRFRSMNPFVPFQIVITKDTPYLNQTASETNFWHHTNATIIAIKRMDALLMSPGPYAVFQENDIIYFIGEEDCFNRVQSFLYPPSPTVSP